MFQDIRAWTCVHVPSRTEGLRRYDHERHKQRNYSIKRYGVALMFLRAHGRKSMPVCLEALLFLCSFVLMSLCFSALAANLIISHTRPTRDASPPLELAFLSWLRHFPAPSHSAYRKSVSYVICDWVTHWRSLTAYCAQLMMPCTSIWMRVLHKNIL